MSIRKAGNSGSVSSSSGDVPANNESPHSSAVKDALSTGKPIIIRPSPQQEQILAALGNEHAVIIQTKEKKKKKKIEEALNELLKTHVNSEENAMLSQAIGLNPDEHIVLYAEGEKRGLVQKAVDEMD